MNGISIIGSGFVGSFIGKGLVSAGQKVIFYDIDSNAIERLTKEGLEATSDIHHAVQNTNISFICVPTPTENNEIDLSYIKSATEKLAEELKTKSEYHLIVIKSTIVPSTTENFILPLLENISGKKCGKDFGLCVNPEFLTQVPKTTTDPELKAWYEKNTFGVKNFEEKAVIGEYDKKSGDMLEEIFKKFNIPIFRTDLKTAEMIKYAHNLHLATKISYWNEIFLICQTFGIDSKLVADVVSTDNRIGKYGVVHGKAFGGRCLPKDLEAFVNFVKKMESDPKLLESVLEINKYMSKKYGVRE